MDGVESKNYLFNDPPSLHTPTKHKAKKERPRNIQERCFQRNRIKNGERRGNGKILKGVELEVRRKGIAEKTGSRRAVFGLRTGA